MARKSTSHAPKKLQAKQGDAPPTRFHLPRSWRVVGARLLVATDADQRNRTARRKVREIRLSGAWLERIGFANGRRYLISVDREIETIYLQAEVAKNSPRRK